MKRKFKQIIKDNFLLRTIEERDIDYLRNLRNENRRFFLYSQEITKQDQQQWYEKYKKNPNDYMFVLCKIDNDQQVFGTVAFYDIDNARKQCEFGRIMIDHKRLAIHGMGQVLATTIKQIARDEFDIRIMRLEVFEDNIPAIKTYLKSGFVVVGEKFLEEKQKNILLMECELI